MGPYRFPGLPGTVWAAGCKGAAEPAFLFQGFENGSLANRGRHIKRDGLAGNEGAAYIFAAHPRSLPTKHLTGPGLSPQTGPFFLPECGLTVKAKKNPAKTEVLTGISAIGTHLTLCSPYTLARIP